MRQVAFKICAVLSLLLVNLAGQAQATGTYEATRHIENAAEVSERDAIGFRNGSFIVVPIPFSDPTLGSGLALGGGYLFRDDDQSDTSVIGIGALRSDNGSEAYGVIANLALRNNRWIVESFFGKADLNYDLFVLGRAIPIRQDGDLARIKFAYGVTPELSFGSTLRYLDTTVSVDGPGSLPPRFALDANLELANLGLTMDWDTRDDSDYPTSGRRLDVDVIYGGSLGGDGRRYRKAFALYDAYQSFSTRSVLAGRVALCAASDETPFFDQCSLGSTDNFRGFSSTEFLDRRLFSAQLEWRQRFNERWGVVAFGGLGWVDENFGDLSADNPQGAAGAGVRYRVSRKFPVDFAVDYSRNDSGDDNLYIFVGQRF